jgi:signal peptidase I
MSSSPRAGTVASGGSAEAPPAAARRPRRWPTSLAIALVVLLGLSVSGLLPVQIARVGSDSMSPTLSAGDLVLIVPTGGPVERMDVVAVEHPDTGVLLVKRAVARGGDQVAIEDGVLVVNGNAVCEPAIDPARLDGVWFGPVTVEDGGLFLLGDERESSIDSRAFGAVAERDVRGQVGTRVWPSPGGLADDRC